MDTVMHTINIFAGAVAITVAIGVVAGSLRRSRRRATPLLASVSALLFVDGLTSLNRGSVMFGMHHRLMVGTLLGIASLASVLVLVAQARQLARMSRLMTDEARYRAAEYERATRHYTQLVRHRMMNPLTVMRGAALTLRHDPGLSAGVRNDLLDAIIAATGTLESTVLAPDERSRRPEELSLVPVPHLHRRERSVTSDASTSAGA